MKNNKRIMTLAEMQTFIKQVGRSELFDELKFIKNREYFNPCTLIGRDSIYLKAITISLMALDYDEKWVQGPFTSLLNHYYNRTEIYPMLKEDFYSYYKAEEVQMLFDNIEDFVSDDEEEWENKISSVTERINDLIFNENLKTKSKKIIQYDLNGKFIRTFDSIKDAYKALGKKESSSAINNCCNGRSNSAYGYIWRYYGEMTNNNK
jgi:hypothetical protein